MERWKCFGGQGFKLNSVGKVSSPRTPPLDRYLRLWTSLNPYMH